MNNPPAPTSAENVYAAIARELREHVMRCAADGIEERADVNIAAAIRSAVEAGAGDLRLRTDSCWRDRVVVGAPMSERPDFAAMARTIGATLADCNPAGEYAANKIAKALAAAYEAGAKDEREAIADLMDERAKEFAAGDDPPRALTWFVIESWAKVIRARSKEGPQR